MKNISTNYVEDINDFIDRCDNFLIKIKEIEIWNMNDDIEELEVIDDNSSEWIMFSDDVTTFIEKITTKFDKSITQSILNLVKKPNILDKQFFSNLKVTLNRLKNFLNTMPATNIYFGDVCPLIHPKILSVSMQKFIDGHYADSVESAFKEINTTVKNIYKFKTGTEKDGADLMRTAFSPNNPVLQFESLDTQTGKNVQQGYMEIFSGSILGIRNPKAHSNMHITKEDALHRLMLASLLMNKIDEAIKFTKIHE